MHATIPKGIVGGFELTRGHRRMFAKAKRKQQEKIRLLQCQEQRIDPILPLAISGLLSSAHFFGQPSLKQL